MSVTRAKLAATGEAYQRVVRSPTPLSSLAAPRRCSDAARLRRRRYGVPAVWRWGEPATLVIGKYCSLSIEFVILLGGNHRPDFVLPCVTGE